MGKRNLTDRTLKALKPAAKGKLYDVMDSVVPGMGVRVSDSGRKTFVLVARFGGAKNPTRRAMGVYDALTLEKAREKARDWLELIRRGVDPAAEEERQRLAEQRRRANTFTAVAEDFIAEKLPGERKGDEVTRDIRKNLIEEWGALPVTDITPDHVAALIKAKAKTAPAQARNLLTTVKRLFQWAIDQRSYGLQASPAAVLKPAALCGEKVARHRLLTKDEQFAFWRAVNRMPYPYGPVYRLLALTGLRLNEVADANWTEFHPDVARAIRNRKDGEAIDWSRFTAEQLVWVIPADRMKGKDSRAQAHAVPLTPEILAILESLPTFRRGNFLFSTTFGEKAVVMSDKIKRRLDARMLRTLQAMAYRRGDDVPAELEPWINHDLRRVVRSGLSRLKIAEETREAVLAHVRPGIKGTYDVHDYLDEKREALTLWSAAFRSVVEPPPANVINLSQARG